MGKARHLMAWTLIISETADKQLSKLDKAIEKKIRAYLEDVCTLSNPADRGHSLTGPYAGLHRYRVGQLRIMVSIERQVITVTVLEVDRRDSIY